MEELRLSLFFFLALQSWTKLLNFLKIFSRVHSRQTSIKNCFFLDIFVWPYCVGFMQESFKDIFGYTWIYTSVWFKMYVCDYILSMLVMLMYRKLSKCFWSSNSTVYFIAWSCLFSISKNISVFKHVAVIYKASECFWDNFVIQDFRYCLTFSFMQITFW